MTYCELILGPFAFFYGQNLRKMLLIIFIIFLFHLSLKEQLWKVDAASNVGMNNSIWETHFTYQHFIAFLDIKY